MSETGERVILGVRFEGGVFGKDVIHRRLDVEVLGILAVVGIREGGERNLSHVEDALSDAVGFFHAFDEFLGDDLSGLVDGEALEDVVIPRPVFKEL